MKVKCIKNCTENNILYDIEIGNEYFVLQIEFYPYPVHVNTFGDFVGYRIVDTNGIMMPIASNLFEITDNSIPDDWVINKVAWDFFELTPKEFLYSSFLEDYYDGDPVAVNLVKSQLKKLQGS